MNKIKQKPVTKLSSLPPSPSPPPYHAILTGRDRGFWRSRWFSFCAALAGVRYTLLTQPNAWIEMVAILLVAILAWWLAVTPLEWGILGLMSFLVLALEAVNTAIEAVVDLVSPEYHPLAKIAKDAAAGAMILIVLGSLCVGAAIFVSKLAG